MQQQLCESLKLQQGGHPQQQYYVVGSICNGHMRATQDVLPVRTCSTTVVVLSLASTLLVSDKMLSDAEADKFVFIFHFAGEACCVHWRPNDSSEQHMNLHWVSISSLEDLPLKKVSRPLACLVIHTIYPVHRLNLCRYGVRGTSILHEAISLHP